MELVSVEPKEVYFMFAFTEDDLENLMEALDNVELKADLKTDTGKKMEKSIQDLWNIVTKTLHDFRGDHNDG